MVSSRHLRNQRSLSNTYKLYPGPFTKPCNFPLESWIFKWHFMVSPCDHEPSHNSRPLASIWAKLASSAKPTHRIARPKEFAATMTGKSLGIRKKKSVEKNINSNVFKRPLKPPERLRKSTEHHSLHLAPWSQHANHSRLTHSAVFLLPCLGTKGFGAELSCANQHLRFPKHGILGVRDG